MHFSFPSYQCFHPYDTRPSALSPTRHPMPLFPPQVSASGGSRYCLQSPVIQQMMPVMRSPNIIRHPADNGTAQKINQVLHIFLIGIISGICLSLLPCCIFMIRRNHYRRNRRQICTSDIRTLCRLLRPDATPFRHSRRIVLRFNLLRWRCRNHFNITVCPGRCCTSHQQKNACRGSHVSPLPGQ